MPIGYWTTKGWLYIFFLLLNSYAASFGENLSAMICVHCKVKDYDENANILFLLTVWTYQGIRIDLHVLYVKYISRCNQVVKLALNEYTPLQRAIYWYISSLYPIGNWVVIVSPSPTAQKATIYQITTMLATSTNVLFPKS